MKKYYDGPLTIIEKEVKARHKLKIDSFSSTTDISLINISLLKYFKCRNVVEGIISLRTTFGLPQLFRFVEVDSAVICHSKYKQIIDGRLF